MLRLKGDNLTVSLGQTVKMTVSLWSAIDTTADLLASYGAYYPGTEEFDAAFGTWITDESIPAGASDHEIYAVTEAAGIFDVAAIVGDYDPETGEFSVIDMLVKRGELMVTYEWYETWEPTVPEFESIWYETWEEYPL